MSNNSHTQSKFLRFVDYPSEPQRPRMRIDELFMPPLGPLTPKKDKHEM